LPPAGSSRGKVAHGSILNDSFGDYRVKSQWQSTEIAQELAEPAPSPVRLHPNLSDLYRRKVEQLADSLRDPAIRPAVLDTIRSLIEAVTVHIDEDGNVTLALDGALSAMIDTSQPGVLRGVDAGSVKVVAGTGFEPVTFRL